MQHALELALALTRQHDEAGLCDWLLETMQAAWQPQGMLLGMVDVSGRQLTCQGRVHETPVALSLGVDDFSHPLAYVLHKNQARTWDSLYGGARIEHREFRQMLASVGTNCGLHALPLLSDSGKPLAVLALLDTPTHLQTLHQRGECERLAQVFCRQLMLLRELAHTRREQVALRDSLRQIKDEGQSRREQEKRVEATLIGRSVAIKELHQQIYQAAKHRLSVLIQGETGSGKDVVARLLHQCSERADKPFIAINCAAIPENLIESELFGYQKGAFSGAQSNKIGLVEQANGGTLFLDEVGDMPQSMQAKLLRVLETHSFRPLGAEKEVHSDFRLIAATHQPLEQQVSDGVFRQDLYHRLCQCLLQVAPLRERPDDIRLLCEHFIGQFADKQQKHVGSLNRAFLRQLVAYDFPGNVRELRNLLEVACAHTPDGEALSLASLPPELRDRLTSSTPEEQDCYQHIHDLRIATQRYEAAVIEARLRQFQGNRLLVADSLNIPKRTLDHKCQKLEVN
ncbi:sigma-54 dependent transcriptional regulator [Pectobacterium polonicum]|uniref:sigma-54 interaction domain-containing protein n=1 Tax=Pectobacterium polonicum TaxID=2485124 RepID=UPI0010F4B1B6|nr:sigma-54 dependent transcriptional regulator [Pectobacterium polonicum]TKY81353.1 sigma-54-dependent Fis family transcriptional regulator [Pectobacterium polonicum]